MMIKGNFKKLAALTFAVALGVGTTAYGATNDQKQIVSNKSTKTTVQKVHIAKKKGFHEPKLFKDLGLTGQDIENARKSGKTIFDLAKEKGYTEAQVRDMIIKENTEAINKAVADGKLTKEQAEKRLSSLKEYVAKWDGTIKEHGFHGRMGMDKTFQRLGLSKEYIINAEKSGKSIFEIAKTKGFTEEQVKNMIIQDRAEAINKAVTDGRITKEEANDRISKMKERISKWDGKLHFNKEGEKKSQ